MLQKNCRKIKFNRQEECLRYICIPREVKEVGSHKIWEFQEGGSLNVPADVEFMHHFRVCEFGGDDGMIRISLIEQFTNTSIFCCQCEQSTT